ncbi:MAG: fatty acid oxidation complex subunit alpha FadB [Betaproteobacteria bacterium]
MFKGESVRVEHLGEGFVELCFDRQGDSINKLDKRTLDELGQANAAIAAAAGVRGVLVTSAKDVFIVGADITEFTPLFRKPEAEIAAWSGRSNRALTDFEAFGVPSVAAINGFALGGGLEFALCAALRVMSSRAQVGLPEVKLGIFPGLGGTVRLPRVAGVQTAVDWVSSGWPSGAEAALQAGVVDAIATPEALRETALALLREAAGGSVDWAARQSRKRAPVPVPAAYLAALFAQAKARVAKGAGRHQPAALAAVALMERSATLAQGAALDEEAADFARIARTQAAASLVQTFLSEQVLKKLFRQHAATARPVRKGAVLGAGIMGGGIAYASVLKGVAVRLKDIAQAQLDLGLGEARKQLGRQVKAGRKTQDQADTALAAIEPQLTYAGFDDVDVVIEAVVENVKVKHAVLSELESVVRPDAVIASNTSSLRIDELAMPLKRPENFVGMHFFNPVPVMQLVEVIRGSRTSDAAVSTAVGYAVAMGKTPIVVKDCPGFLVNRLLTPYVRGFLQLIGDGADFEKIDRVLEAFGWPMGPAYLEDVIGMDTGSHVSDLISAGYAERMPPLERDALRLMVRNERYGQKNGIGFYKYEVDPAGKPRRSVAADTRELLATLQLNGPRDFSDAEIVDRTMLPMIIEAAHALEDGVVASPAELDMALLLGIGFPAYLGGALKYADWLGLAEVVRRADQYAALGGMYVPTAAMRAMAAEGRTYYSQ